MTRDPRRERKAFIILSREDIASTVASPVVADRWKTWRRSGEAHTRRWRFQPEDERRVRSHLEYLRSGRAQLNRIAGAIRITYEALCSPGFQDRRLDEFFGRPIRIPNSKGPVCGADYAENWEIFRDFVDRCRLADPRP